MPNVNIASVRIRSGLSLPVVADYLNMTADQYLSYEWNNYLPAETVPSLSKLFLMLPDRFATKPESQYAMDRGRFLARLRHCSKLACDDFSFLLSHSTVQRWETGKATPQYQILSYYVAFYGYSIDQVLLCSQDNQIHIERESVEYYQKVELCLNDRQMSETLGISLAKWKAFLKGSCTENDISIMDLITEHFQTDSSLFYVKLNDIQKRILTESPDPKSISFCRCLAGFSQRQVSDKLGISQASIAKLETGSSIPSLARLKSIAALYRVPLEKFWQPAPENN